jgi:hypothetical protein
LTRFVAVCYTVAYAHSRCVLHRDLKPSNVMLGRYGETLLVDWGLAKQLAEPPAQGPGDATLAPALVPGLVDGVATQAGATLGTPAYMSPEQAAGRRDQLGPASDIYGLEATLYTLLTGRPPVDGKDLAEVLGKARRGDWPPPRRVKADVPSALNAVCRKALALQPEQRYATALALAADVERWLADEPVSAWREPWAVRGWRWLGKHRTLVTSAAAVVVAVVGLTVGLVLLAVVAEGEARARKMAEEMRNDATEQRNEARRNLYIAQINLVQREYEATNLVRVRELLEAQASWPPGAEDPRGFEWHYWNRLAHGELRTLGGGTGAFFSVAFSPDCRRLAAGNGDKTVRVWDAVSGREALTLKGHPAKAAREPVLPDTPRFSGGQHGADPLVNDIATLN